MHNTAQTPKLKPLLTAQEWMNLACAYWSIELARLLESVLGGKSEQDQAGIRFLSSQAVLELDKLGLNTQIDDIAGLVRKPPAESPLGRLVKSQAWSATDIGLFIIAGLAEIHEGYADILRMVNPENRARAATGLAAQLLSSVGDRDECEYALQAGPAVRSGALIVDGDGPLFTRHIKLAEGLWSTVNGLEVWPNDLPQHYTEAAPWGLESWLNSSASKHARQLLFDNANLAVCLQAETLSTAINRAFCLTLESGRKTRIFTINAKTELKISQLIHLHCTARGLVPIFAIADDFGEQSKPVFLPAMPKGSVVIASSQRTAYEFKGKPLSNIPIHKLTAEKCAQIWAGAIPALKDKAQVLASRFPVEPHIAAEIANDLSYTNMVSLDDVSLQIRARAGGLSKAGITLITPAVDWDQLVLPSEQYSQLKESIQRLEYQTTVLDKWGFLKQRRGARGVRLLLSGPPGTGKTLSAEVLANELGVDLLIVDISRVVSKWIGETEKNLELAFAAAEQSKAVLLFDEADALFGKRTDVNDANDRNANLETAYLLTRLESFEGLVVMSTNMRNNIDPAFLRRLEYIIEFDEPDKLERKSIWQCHVPDQAPLEEDVDFAELAAMFPVVGGVIKNASVSAAFRAAAGNRPICKNDFIQALRREYEKQGKAFPAVKQLN